MRSPRRKPAVRAGPASLKPSTTTPSAPPLVCRPSQGRGRRLVTRPAAISSSFTGRNVSSGMARLTWGASPSRSETTPTRRPWSSTSALPPHDETGAWSRSEEHTSELQSPCNLVCRLLLEKKKKDGLRHQTPEKESEDIHTEHC